MKIEFCCEVLKSQFLHRDATIMLEGEEVWLEEMDNADSGWAHCPYCGAKIEITVRKEEK